MPNIPEKRIMKPSVKKKPIVKVLGSSLAKPLNKKAALKKITMGDLDVIERQLNKLFQKQQADYVLQSCGACCSWP